MQTIDDALKLNRQERTTFYLIHSDRMTPEEYLAWGDPPGVWKPLFG
jgi:hypothetical protein